MNATFGVIAKEGLELVKDKAVKAVPEVIDLLKVKSENKKEKTKARAECVTAVWTKTQEKEINRDNIEGEIYTAILNDETLTVDEKKEMFSNASNIPHERRLDENSKLGVISHTIMGVTVTAGATAATVVAMPTIKSIINTAIKQNEKTARVKIVMKTVKKICHK